MDLSSATGIIDAVKSGLLAIMGIGVAIAIMLAFARYFTSGADEESRGDLISRLIHIGGTTLAICLVIAIATPLTNALMSNGVSQEYEKAASGNSWLPKVDVGGKKVAVNIGDGKLGKDKTLGAALKRVPHAAIQNADGNVAAYNLLSATQKSEYEKAVKAKNGGTLPSVISEVTGSYDADASITEMGKILSVKDWMKTQKSNG